MTTQAKAPYEQVFCCGGPDNGLQLKKVDTLRVTGCVKIIRQVIFLAAYLLKWPLLWMAGGLGLFDYLFLVYPGTESDLDGYIPASLKKHFSGWPSLAGVITRSRNGKIGRGLCLVIPDSAEELVKNKALCQAIATKLLLIQRISGAKAIGMAGALPWIFQHHGINLNKPFVRGEKGIIFSLLAILEKTRWLPPFSKSSKDKAVIVGGSNPLGRLVKSALLSAGHNTKLGTNAKQGKHNLRQADVVIVLVPDFAFLHYLKKGVKIFDEAHPRLGKIAATATLYKVAAELKGTRFFLRLPGYKQKMIPACAIEAMLASATECFNLTEEQFQEEAYSRGIGALAPTN